jgi:glycerol uptake facilitator-like aquaporin
VYDVAIGLTLALDIMAGGPITGTAMNPARTFGPGVVDWGPRGVTFHEPDLAGAPTAIAYFGDDSC